MARTLTVISADNGRDGFVDVCNAINAQFADRNLIGDLDGIDASWDVCFADAVQTLGGTWSAKGDDYYVALDGAPLARIMLGG